MKFPQTSSRIKILKYFSISGTQSVPETLKNYNILIRLLAQENIIEKKVNFKNQIPHRELEKKKMKHKR
jgi:hypothetical protein